MTENVPAKSDDRRDTVSRMLQDSALDDPKRADELLPLLYEELRALARARVARERDR